MRSIAHRIVHGHWPTWNTVMACLWCDDYRYARRTPPTVPQHPAGSSLLSEYTADDVIFAAQHGISLIGGNR